MSPLGAPEPVPRGCGCDRPVAGAPADVGGGAGAVGRLRGVGVAWRGLRDVRRVRNQADSSSRKIGSSIVSSANAHARPARLGGRARAGRARRRPGSLDAVVAVMSIGAW